MPHKHKRRHQGDADYELPPNIVAHPLSTSKSRRQNEQTTKNVHKKQKKTSDDTPKEFARLMSRMNAHQKPAVRGKNGNSSSTSRRVHSGTKAKAAKNNADPDEKDTVVAPQIMPGERMADFSARVDQALPLHGLVTKGRVRIEGVKQQRTKLEKKITRMQDEWREVDRRYKEKVAEAEEDEEIEAILNGDDKGRKFKILDEETSLGEMNKNGKNGKRKSSKRKGYESDDDPWAELAKSRREAEQQGSGLIGVHDVVQAPPKLDVKPREIFKTRAGTDIAVDHVPSAAGSLRQREELSRERNRVLQSYRARSKSHMS